MEREVADSKSEDGFGRGFHYTVGPDQLRIFASLTPDQRLTWLEELREFSVMAAPPEAQKWWRRFREGR
jgi:hypothetical protein